MKIEHLLLVAITSLGLASCGGGDDGGVKTVKKEDVPDYIILNGDETVYRARDYILHSTWAGYDINREYFAMEEGSETLRIYDNVYLYAGDVFYVTNQKKDSYWAVLGENSDADYFKTIELPDRMLVDVKRDGVYTITFDVESKALNAKLKADILGERCYPLDEIYLYQGDEANEMNRMEKVPGKAHEYCLLNYGVSYSRHICITTRNRHDYLTVALSKDTWNRTVVKYNAESPTRTTIIYPLVEGKMNFYFNSETYTLRAEFVDKERSGFYIDPQCTHIDELSASVEHPYIFKGVYDTEKYGASVPSVYGPALMNYPLEFIGEFFETVTVPVGDSEITYTRFKVQGKYDVVINLFDMTVDATLRP